MKTITKKTFTKYGINPKNYKPNKYEMSYYIKPNVCDQYHADVVENYVLGILNGSITSKYVTGNTMFDSMVDLFFDKDNYHKPEMEVVLFSMSRMANVLKRQILSKNLSFSEQIDAKSVREAFFTDGKYKGGSLMKVVAWFTIHSFLTGLFIVPESCYEIMKITSSSDTAIKFWNDAVQLMDDIGTNMKAYFSIDPTTKTSGFMDEYTPETIKERRRNLIDETIKAEAEHPEDDEAIFDDSADKNKILDDMFKRKVDEPDREKKPDLDPTKEVTFVAAKHDSPESNAGNIVSSINKDDVMKEAVTFGDVAKTIIDKPEECTKAENTEKKEQPVPEKKEEAPKKSENVVASIPVDKVEPPKKENKPKNNDKVVFKNGRIRVI